MSDVDIYERRSQTNSYEHRRDRVMLTAAGSRTAWVVSIASSLRTSWVAGQLWRAPTAYRHFTPVLLLLISYEQKTQTLELSDVVTTVLAAAIRTTEYSRHLVDQCLSVFTTEDPSPKASVARVTQYHPGCHGIIRRLRPATVIDDLFAHSSVRHCISLI